MARNIADIKFFFFNFFQMSDNYEAFESSSNSVLAKITHNKFVTNFLNYWTVGTTWFAGVSGFSRDLCRISLRLFEPSSINISCQ